MSLKLIPTEDPRGELDHPSPRSAQRPKDVLTRWGGNPEILAKGFVGVPVLFLERLALLKPYPLSPAEALFVVCLMAHKWDDRAPYPSYRRIAAWMGKSESYARTLARNLEIKKLLRRLPRIGQSNAFDLQPLFDAIVSMSPRTAKAKPSSPRKAVKLHRRGTARKRKRASTAA